MRLIIIAKFNYSPFIPLMSLKMGVYQNEIEKMVLKDDNITQNMTKEEKEEEEEKFELYFKGNSVKYFQKYFFPHPNPNSQIANESAVFMKKCVKKILKELSNTSFYNVYKHGFYGSITIHDNAKLTHISKKVEKQQNKKLVI